MYTADQVWALAVIADRINGGYCKEPVWDFDIDQREPVKQPNKVMVKAWLRANDFSLITAADIQQGQACRNYFNGYLLKQIAGRINEFEGTALRIAQMDEFTGQNLLEFGVISCLPSVLLREQHRRELNDHISTSTQLQGSEGDRIQGTIEVFGCNYRQDYDKFKIQARMGDSYVDFWFGTALKDTVMIRAKIKRQRGDLTTQLNYVKVIG